MKKYFLLIMINAVVTACSSAEKSEASDDGADRKPTKLSVKSPDYDTLKLGLLLKVAKQYSHLEKEFQAQLPKFQQCQNLGKSQDFRADVSWVLARDGEFEQIKFLKLFPESEELKTCLLRQFNRLKMDSQVAPIEGELVLGSFSGEVPAWLRPPQPQMRE